MYTQDALPSLLRLLVSVAPPNTFLSFFALHRTPTKHVRKRIGFFPANLEGATRLYHNALCLDALRWDCYVQCTLLGHKPPPGRRGTTDYVAGSCVCYADVDRPERPTDLNLPTPTISVSSGNGWHLYFGLREFCTDLEAIKKANISIRDQYRGDHCQDVCHVLRIPGTHNYKDPTHPKPVIEVDADGPIYSRPQDLTTNANITTTPPAPIYLPDAIEPTVEDYARLSGSLQKKIRGKVPDDRSGHDYSIGNQLLAAGWSIGKIRWLMEDPRSSISSKVLANPGPNNTYLKLTLGKLAEQLYASGLAPRIETRAILAQIIYSKRRTPDGHLIVGIPDAAWCEPAIKELKRHGVTFRRDVDDPEQGYIGTTEGLLHTASQRFNDWLTLTTGYTCESAIHSTLAAWIQVEARRRTCPTVKLRPWALLEKGNPSHPRFLMVADLEGCSITEVTLSHPIKCTQYPNGERGVLLRQSNRLHRVIPPNSQQPLTSLCTLRELFTDVLACSDISREILTAYLLAAPLTRAFEIVTLPLLYLTGVSGEGKTQTTKLMSTYFHGVPKVIGSGTIASLYGSVAAEIFVPFDDYDKLSDAIKSFILTTVTGAERQKCGDKANIIQQDLHVLLSFNSTKELEEEPLRRRALRIEISKTRWHGREYFSEEHWKKLNAKRDAIWWAWLRFLGTINLKGIIENFGSIVQETEQQITVSANKPLAGFLTLLYEIFKRAAPILGMPKGQASPIKNWLKELNLLDIEEVEERHDLLHVLDSLFEVVLNDIAFSSCLDQGQENFKGHLGHLMDAQYNLDYQYERGWVTFIGSTSQWWTTLRYASRGQYRRSTATTVGNDFKALIGESPRHEDGNKSSPPYKVGRFVIHHILNAGKARTSRGWKVGIFYPLPS